MALRERLKALPIHEVMEAGFTYNGKKVQQTKRYVDYDLVLEAMHLADQEYRNQTEDDNEQGQ